ncbi:diaminopimelate epimerase [Methylomonas sp. YC3]
MIFFTKMQGLGNDFVVIDAINQPIQLTTSQIRFLADRHFGVGCDQLLLVEKPVSDNAEFKYRIFNADGSEVAQCGNGARCFARFVRDKGLSNKDEITVDTDARQLTLRFDAGGLITVDMGVPALEPEQIPLKVSEQSTLYKVTLADTEVAFAAVSMGNPHAVILVDDVISAPVSSIGARLESHELFPERANIGFMQIVNRRQIKLRVYERGAAETLACGSGACAAVVAGIEQGLLEQDVQVQLPGGELIVSWLGSGHPVMMTGAATTVFEGQIKL